MSSRPDSPVNFALPAKQTRAKNASFPLLLGYGKCHSDFFAYIKLSRVYLFRRTATPKEMRTFHIFPSTIVYDNQCWKVPRYLGTIIRK